MKNREEIINEVHERVSKELPNMTDAHDETWEQWAELARELGKVDLSEWIIAKDKEFDNAAF